MSAWLITTNPNWHAFSLLHFQCTSHYSKYHGSDAGPCPHFCSKPLGPTSMGSAVREVQDARGGGGGGGGLLKWLPVFVWKGCYIYHDVAKAKSYRKRFLFPTQSPNSWTLSSVVSLSSLHVSRLFTVTTKLLVILLTMNSFRTPLHSGPKRC